MPKMTLDQALLEWKSKKHLERIGCVSAANWFCTRVKGFRPVRLTRAAGGVLWEHVVITDGSIIIDPSPWNDVPEQ